MCTCPWPERVERRNHVCTCTHGAERTQTQAGWGATRALYRPWGGALYMCDTTTIAPPPPWRGSGVVPWDSKDRPDVPSRRLLWRPAPKRPTEEVSQARDRHRFRSRHRVRALSPRAAIAHCHEPDASTEADVPAELTAGAETGPTPTSEPVAGFVALDSADFREVYHSADGGFDQRWGEPGAPPWLEELDATAAALTAGMMETSELLAGRNTFVEVVPTRLAQGLAVMVEALRSDDGTQITVVASESQSGDEPAASRSRRQSQGGEGAAAAAGRHSACPHVRSSQCLTAECMRSSSLANRCAAMPWLRADLHTRCRRARVGPHLRPSGDIPPRSLRVVCWGRAAHGPRPSCAGTLRSLRARRGCD